MKQDEREYWESRWLGNTPIDPPERLWKYLGRPILVKKKTRMLDRVFEYLKWHRESTPVNDN